MSRVEQAFSKVDRSLFLPNGLKESAFFDCPLPIGFGQTNSQPSTVRLMLSWLDPLPGEKILDVGSGSGWTTALLSYLVGPTGQVYAVEKVPQLVDFGRKNCQSLDLNNVFFFETEEEVGLSAYGPFDRILVSASASQLPPELLRQLKPWGRLVIPIKNSVDVIEKVGQDNFKHVSHPGFAFVPLI